MGQTPKHDNEAITTLRHCPKETYLSVVSSRNQGVQLVEEDDAWC